MGDEYDAKAAALFNTVTPTLRGCECPSCAECRSAIAAALRSEYARALADAAAIAEAEAVRSSEPGAAWLGPQAAVVAHRIRAEIAKVKT
jgi:hypothetical protein